MRLATIALLIGALVTVGSADGIAWHESVEASLAAAAETGKPVLMVFNSGGDCGWCVQMGAETLVAPEVTALAASFEAVQINGLQRDDLATKYLVAGYPTVVFLAPGGEVIEKVSGYLPPEMFTEVMRGALDAHAALQQARALEAAIAGQQPAPEQLLAIARQYAKAKSFERAVEWGNRTLASGDEAVLPEALLLVGKELVALDEPCLLYTSPSPRDS